MKLRILILFLCVVLLGSCAPRNYEPCMTSISITDRNGLSETISSADRLNQYENVDFLANQPYQKVLRVYDRDSAGNISAYITSYHSNGQPNQYLELENGRALGTYQEWYSDGKQKLEATVIGGIADISQAAQQSWLFDGLNKVWGENGELEAEILYSKGELEGTSIYYHPNHTVWKRIPYHKHLAEGIAEVFLDDGTLLQSTQYAHDLKHGPSIRYWAPEKVSVQEEYAEGLLKTALYFDVEGILISEIKDGNGYRVVFGKDYVSELHEYKHGVQAGEVKVFTKNGRLIKRYHIKNGIKHGEEIEYYDNPACTSIATMNLKPKLSLHWYEGRVQGIVRTWYDTGTLESQREMSNNAKNGVLTAWYHDGSLMLIEEYDKDKLVKGEYFKKGDKIPTSVVSAGKGTATMFDPEGTFVNKVNY